MIHEFHGLTEKQQDWVDDYAIECCMEGKDMDEDYIFEKLVELDNE